VCMILKASKKSIQKRIEQIHPYGIIKSRISDEGNYIIFYLYENMRKDIERTFTDFTKVGSSVHKTSMDSHRPHTIVVSFI
jgi:hypothetical protein